MQVAVVPRKRRCLTRLLAPLEEMHLIVVVVLPRKRPRKALRVTRLARVNRPFNQPRGRRRLRGFGMGGVKTLRVMPLAR